MIGEYINTTGKVKIRHNCEDCNHYEFETNWYNFCHQKTKCPYCSKRKTNKDFVAEVYALVKDEYTLMSKYKDCHAKVLFRHNCGKCDNNEFYMRPYNFLSGNRCPKCFDLNKKYSLEEVKNEIVNITSGEYIMIGDEYLGCMEKIKLIHVSCGMEFYTTRTNFVCRNRRCPYCSISSGENIIKECLVRSNVDFEIQKKFDDLIGTGGGKLSYDFYLPNHNALIEFQGRQHYEPVERFGGQEQFEKQCIHDEIKRCYAKGKGFNLIEIPYWDFDNVENILLEKTTSKGGD